MFRVVDDEFPGVGGVEDVFGVFLGEEGEFGFDCLEAFFGRGIEFGAVFFEVGEDFF